MAAYDPKKKATTILMTVKNVMDKLTLNARYNTNDRKKKQK